MIQRTRGEKIFAVVNYILVGIVALSMLYPVLYTLTISLSTPAEAEKIGLHILPNFKTINLDAYKMVFKNQEIWAAYKITIFRTVVGTLFGLMTTCLYAYALSRRYLPLRKFFTTFLMLTMFFSGGTIPIYLNIKSLGLINSIWVYIFSSGLSTYNVIVARSFFESLPESLNESARIDGAGELRIFLQIVVPLSKPIIMTLALWMAVGAWNEWFVGMMYITDYRKQVVQNYLQRIINEGNTNLLSAGSAGADGSMNTTTPETIKSASIIVTMLPILCVYPFIQKYFVKGVTLGAVKG